MAGRPKGSKNKRQQFSCTLTKRALEHFTKAVDQGEQWAIQMVIASKYPKLKPVTPENSIDAQLIEARIFELTEIESRLSELERIARESKHT